MGPPTFAKVETSLLLYFESARNGLLEAVGNVENFNFWPSVKA